MPQASFSSPSHYFSPHQTLLRESELRWNSSTLAGRTLHFATGAGVFAKSGLDAGSQLLLQHAVWPDGSPLCDLGCGWGALACFAAARTPQSTVFACDINVRAVALARLNAQRNELPNVRVWCGDGLSAVKAESFAAILCNPPVRAGNEVIARMFADAQRCLHPDGALWVVLRTAQGAKSWQKRLAAQFGGCDTIAIEAGFRILKAHSLKAHGAKANSLG